MTLATGHNMLGLSLAPATGKLVAELLTGREAPYRGGAYSRNASRGTGTKDETGLARDLFAVGLDFPVLDELAGPVGHVLDPAESLRELQHLGSVLGKEKSQACVLLGDPSP